MKKLLIFGFILILLVANVQASIIATIGMQGLKIIDSKAADAVNSIICIANPACVEGMIISQIYGEAMKALAKESPEAYQALSIYNQIKGYVDKGAQIHDELLIDDKGKIEKGQIEFSNEEKSNIGNLIGENLKEEDISVKGIDLVKRENNSFLVFKHNDSEFCVKGNCFSNIKKQSKETDAYIKLDENGTIIQADITSNKNGGTYRFGQKTVKVPPNTRLTYENGKIYVHGEKEFDLTTHSLEEKILGYNKIQVGDSRKLVRIEGNEITGEDFKILDKDSELIAQVYEGKVTLFDDKVTKVWEKSHVAVRGIEHKTLADNLNLYYDNNFNPLEHPGENYFNYGRGTIWLGGEGFTSTFKEGNEIFPEFKETRYIKGTPYPKKGIFQITPNNGFLELEKYDENKDLGFIVKTSGDFEIVNGRVIIKSENGIIYTKKNPEHDISYDLNLNNEYVLDDFLFFKKDETLVVNYNTPWENTIRKVKGIDKSLRDKIKQDLQTKWGVRPRNFFGYMNSEGEEDLIKWVYEGAVTANKNVYGVKIYPSELYTTLVLEGAGGPEYGVINTDYRDDHYFSPISAYSTFGLDTIGYSSEMKRLKEGGFIPSDFELVALDRARHELDPYKWTETGDVKNLQEGLIALAGVLAQKKHTFLKDFENHFGKEELEKLTDDETYFWTYLYFNCGEGCGKGKLTGTRYKSGSGKIVQGAGREKIYKPLEYPEPNTLSSSRVNSLIRMVTKKWFDSFDLFDYY